MKYQYDLIVIGSGSSGFSAASTAKANGIKKILLIEKRQIGYSLCTNEGCMPSKTLLSAAYVKNRVDNAREFGIVSSKAIVNWEAVQKRAQSIVIDDFVSSRSAMIKKSGIKTVKGSAKFLSSNEIKVGSKIYSSKKFIIATGSVSIIPPIEGLNDIDYLDSSKALALKKLPKSLIVVGGGYISMELGYLFHAMGVKVTILERGDYLLKRLDSDIGYELQDLMKKNGINIINNMSVNWVKKQGGKIVVCANVGKPAQGGSASSGEHCVSAEQILLATGRRPDIDKLDLEKAGIKLSERGGFDVNDYLQTNQKHIYAVGDVNGKVPLVYVASQEGRIAGSNAFSKKQQKMDYNNIANIIFSHPEIGTVGLTEQEAKDQGYKIIVAKTPMGDIGKAVALGETGGFVKMIAEKPSGKILGLHILGAHATDIMQVALPHIYHGDTVFDVMKIPYPHPTLGEALAYPAEDIANTLSK
jgi:dihydrolipoamide dehydrogenase